jgi:hypothetical protein
MTPKALKHPEPTRTQLIVFGLLLPVFFLLLGLIAMYRPRGLVVAASVCAAAAIVSIALDARNRFGNLIGLAIPLLLMLIALPVKMGVDPHVVATVCVIFGVILGAIVLISASAGRAIYDFWMRVAEPIGLTFSMLMLVVAFYGVFTPIGLLMKILGRDPLERAYDRGASTYWVAHNPAGEPERYFKQF